MPMIEEFDEPSSLEDAEHRRIVLVAEIQEIEVQLGDQLKINDYSNEDDYEKWRTNAQWAKTLRLQNLRLTKAWIRKTRREANAAEVSG